MLKFDCPSCRTSLSAEEAQAGQLVRCPTCLTTLRVPVPVGAAAAEGSPAPLAVPSPNVPIPPPRPRPPATSRSSGRKYGFNCAYCSSRLEANESQGGSDGTCPTCGESITIPILDRYGRLIDPRTNQIIKPDPHPVHAYAAAGERAPIIKRRADGAQEIVCARCGSTSPISANNCKTCGNPFTMEGTTVEGTGEGGGFAAASLVLGIVSIPGFCLVIVGPLAVVFGGIAIYQMRQTGASGRGMAIAGIICGSIGTVFTLLMWK